MFWRKSMNCYVKKCDVMRCKYLVTAFAVNCHNKANAASLMFICRIIKTLCCRSFPFLLLVFRSTLVAIDYATSWRWLDIDVILVRWRHLQLGAAFNRSLYSAPLISLHVFWCNNNKYVWCFITRHSHTLTRAHTAVWCCSGRTVRSAQQKKNT